MVMEHRPTAAQVEAELLGIARSLAPLRPERLIVHGSVARGDWNRASDIDLLVVMESRRRFIERVQDVMALLDTSLPVEPLVYTPQEFAQGLASGHPFLTRAVREGRELHVP